MKAIHIHPSARMIMDSNIDLGTEADRKHFLATIERAGRFTTGNNVKHVDVYLADRDDSGWLQHGIYVRKQDGGGDDMYIAAIQRSENAPSEFCS